MKITKGGLKYDFVSAKDAYKFEGYDYAIASCHVKNYGIIVVDEYGSPIDNEFSLEMIFDEN